MAVAKKKDKELPSSLAPSHKKFASDLSDLDFSVKPPVPKVKSLYQMVDERLQVRSRGAVVRELTEVFKCSVITVDRAIQDVHADWKAFANQTRAQRMQRYMRRKETLYDRTLAKGDERTANQIVETLAETLGDKKPDIHMLLGGDKTPAQLLAQSDELRRLTEDLEDEDA